MEIIKRQSLTIGVFCFKNFPYLCKMSEIDIWIKAMDKLGFKFIDEFCGPNLNYIKYKHEGVEYSLYFNRKTEMVEVLFSFNGDSFLNTKITKQSFYDQYIDIFRDIKLESIV
jgi:hypothetical protein